MWRAEGVDPVRGRHRRANGPIEGLLDHLVARLESPERGDPEGLARAVADGRFSGEIIIDPSNGRPVTPRVQLATRTVHLSDGYLHHLWAFIYGAWVTIERLQVRLAVDPSSFDLTPRDALERRAWDLFDWSVSLVDRPSAWPDLPRPDRDGLPPEKRFVEKASTLFVDAVAFVILHELAHLNQGHGVYAGPIDSNDAELLASRVDLEREADQVGLDFLHTVGPLEGAPLVSMLPALMVMGSALFLAGMPAGLVQRTHPDVDVRLLNVLQRVSREDRGRADYARLLCRFFFDLFLQRHGITPPPGPFRDSDEALEAAVEAINVCKGRDR